MTGTRVIVSALIEKEGKYLFLRQNKPGGAYPGTLHLPGGGIEPKEHPDDAVRREILEETHITVKNLKPFDFDSDVTAYKGGTVPFIFLRYTCSYESGTPRAGSDAKELVWLSREDIKTAPHNPPSLRLLTRLGLLGP